jgi:Protein of unknown function (DUF3800)
MNDQKIKSLFLDESGKPEVFNNQGNKNLVLLGNASKFLILCSVSTFEQLSIQQQINEFRLSLLKDDQLKHLFTSTYSLSDFHAYLDYPIIRKRFLIFVTSLSNIKIDIVVAEKLKLPLVFQQHPNSMYGVLSGLLLADNLDCNCEIIFSRKDTKLRLQKEIEIEVEKTRLTLNSRNNLPTDVKINYLHNPHHTHGCLQIADYIAYAVFQKYENNKEELYEIIKDKINSTKIVTKK